MKSCLYEGMVRHRRYRPRGNEFVYTLYFVYLDLAELDEVFWRRWLWSTRRPNVAWLRRGDHVGDPSRTIDASVRDLVEERTGRRPEGPIRLLTHLRYFGYCFNPVSFYYCFDRDDQRLETIVAEVNNTPWGEQHYYVLDDPRNRGTEQMRRWRFGKTFHVSPFMDEAMDYDWRFTPPGERLFVHMDNLDGDGKLFDATMTLRRRAITGPALAGALLRFPLMTGKVIAAIYWQALKLWWKGVPYVPHPRAKQASTPQPEVH